MSQTNIKYAGHNKTKIDKISNETAHKQFLANQ